MRKTAMLAVIALLLNIQVPAQEYVQINRIDIKRFKPAISDVRAFRHLDKSTVTMTDEQIAATRDAYVVRFFAEMPPASAQLPRLLIDGRDVVQYGHFSQGLFLKVYSLKQLAGWATKRVAIVIPTPEPIPVQPASPLFFPRWHEEEGNAPASLTEVLKQP